MRLRTIDQELLEQPTYSPNRPLETIRSDIPATVVFLASEETGFITGAVIDMNGSFLVD